MRKILFTLIISSICLTFFTASAQFNTAYWQKRALLTDYPNPSGMVALWRLDENPPVKNGNILYDYFGIHNGTFVLPVSGDRSIAGVKFRGVDFSGGNYYGTITNGNPDFNRTSSSTITVMGWMRTTAALGDNCILAAFNYTASSGVWCIESLDNSTISYWDDSSSHSVSVGAISTGVWNHVALTLSGSTAKLYWNGSLVLSTTGSTTTRNNHDVQFSGDNYGGSPRLKLDEVSFWNRALSASEIQTIFSNQGYSSANGVWINTLKAFNITSTSFDVSANFIGDLNNNSTATLYYCDNTASPGCNPTTGSSRSLTKSGPQFIGSVTGLAYPAGDTVNIRVTVTDADGSGGGPLNATIRLIPATPTLIYRSVAASATSALATGSGANQLTISGTTATFSSPLANNIGVGDAIQYDDVTDSVTPSKIMFISGRTSSTVYTVATATGGAPTTTGNRQNWKIFRAYTSLANISGGTENTGIDAAVRNFDAGNRNTVTNNERWFFAMYGNGTSGDTSVITLSGWTTDKDHYIQIYSPTQSSEVGVSQRAAGVWDTSKYYISTSGQYDTVLTIQMSNVRIIGIQIDESYAGAAESITGIYYSTGSTGEQYAAYNIIRFSGVSTKTVNDPCIYLANPNNTSAVYVYNNILYGCGSGIRYEAGASNSNFYIYNNTVYNTYGFGIGIGVYSGNTSSFYVVNNISYGTNGGSNVDYFFNLSGAKTSVVSNNISSDSTGTTATLTFANAAGKDFHLSASDTAAIDKGVDLGHPYLESDFNFNDDIDGNLRPTNAWDIGADER